MSLAKATRSEVAAPALEAPLPPSVAETPQQHGNVRALGAVERVQLVHHQIAQRVGLLAGPQPGILGAQQQEVQHLVVGQQNVGRVLAQRMAVGDNREAAVGQLLNRFRELVGCITHVQASTDILQRRRFDDFPCQPGGLIRGQRIHRVEDDGLDPRTAEGTLLAAVLQNGIEKTLSLARTGARGHQGGAGITATETFKGPALMGMRHETGRQPWKGSQAIGRRRLGPEWQRQRQIGATKQVAVGVDEAVDEAFEGDFWWLRLTPCRKSRFPCPLRRG